MHRALKSKILKKFLVFVLAIVLIFNIWWIVYRPYFTVKNCYEDTSIKLEESNTRLTRESYDNIFELCLNKNGITK